MNWMISYRLWDLKMQYAIILAVMACFLILPNETFATHIVGGQMTYECLGNNMYRITVEMRRDCFEGADDAQFDDPMSVGIFNGNGQLRTDLGLFGQLFIPFNGSDTLNEILTSECRVEGPDVCVHTTTYSAVILLPPNPAGNGYILAYQRCCRNQLLSNIVNPLNTGATWFIHMTPQAMSNCNSSPNFKDWPSIYLCANEEVMFDHSAVDKDGDSLVYFLCRPTRGATAAFPRPQPPPGPPYNMVTYNQGFDELHPMGVESISIDPQTGILTVDPTMQNQYLIGVCVDEYRDGVLMSRVRRDFEYNVRICIRNPIAEFETAMDTVCTGLDMSFQNNSSGSQFTEYTWYFDYPDTTKTSNEISPEYQYDSPGSYDVWLIAEDGGCLDTAMVTIGVSIEDDPMVDFGFSILDCTDSIEIQLEDLTESMQELTNWEWEVSYDGIFALSDEQNPSFTLPPEVDSIHVRLEVNTESGCTNSKEMSFGVGIMDVEVSAPELICQGDTISILISTSDAEAEYTYQYGPQELLVSGGNSNMPSFYIPDSGDVELTYSVSDKYGCEVSGVIDIYARPLPVVNLMPELIQCLGDSIGLNPAGVLGYTYVWNSIGSDLLVDVTAMNPRVSVSEITDFEVVITTDDAYECTITDTVRVIPPAEIGLQMVTEVQIICPGNEILLEASSLVDVSFEWFDEDGMMVGEGNSIPVIPDSSAIYTVIATNSFGCSEEASVNIEVSPPIQLFVQTGQDVQVCFATEVLLTASATTEVNFEWTNENGDILSVADSLLLNATSDTLITVTATDINGCTESQQIQITTEGDIDLQVDAPDTISCIGESITLLAMSGSGTNIQWFDASGQLISSESQIDVIADTTTSYYIVASNDFGCTQDTTVVLQVTPEIFLTASPDTTVCYESELILTGTGSGTMNISYEWRDQSGVIIGSGSELAITVTNDSLLTIFATDENGCIFSEDVQVSVIDDINLRIDQPSTPICFSQRVFLRAFTDGPADIEWYDESGENLLEDDSFIVIEPDTTTSYYVRAINASGCVDDTIVTVEVLPEITFVKTPDTLVCYGEEVILSAQSNIFPVSYAWLDEDRNILSTDSTLSLMPVMDRNIQLIIINQFGCAVMDTARITVTEEIGLAVDYPVDHSCFGDSISFMASSTGSGVMVEWFNVFGEMVGSGDELTVLADSTTTYSAVATNQNGCMEDTSFVFQVAPEIVFVRTPDTTICRMEEIVLTATGSGTLTYSWYDLNGDLLSDADTILVMPMDTTMVEVVATNEFGCTASDTVAVMISPPINLSAGEENFKYCEGESKTITVTSKPGTMIIWYDANDQIVNVGNEYTLTPEGDVPIKIIASDQYSCEEMIEATISAYELDIDLSGDEIVCEEEQGTLSVTNNDPMQSFDFLWTPVESIVGDNMASSITIEPDEETTYTVFMTNQDGCMFDTTFTVGISSIADVEISAEREQICLGQTTQLFVVDNPEYTYSWTPAEFLDNPTIPNPTATPVDEVTVFQVVVTNADGCTATDDITIRTEQPVCTEEDIFIPNLFTPNGDGVNDIFEVESNYIDELFMVIYNRWGQKVYETRDVMGGWNGGELNDLNKPMGIGVYGYIVEVVCLNGLEYRAQGNVTLMR